MMVSELDVLICSLTCIGFTGLVLFLHDYEIDKLEKRIEKLEKK